MLENFNEDKRKNSMTQFSDFHTGWSISLIFTLIVGIGSLLPPNKLPDEIKLFPDKLLHLVSYFVLHFMWSITYSRASVHVFFFIAFLLFVYSGLIELLQGLHISGRTADISDFFANGIGIGISLIVFVVWKKTMQRP